MTRSATVASGRFAAGHLGELTRVISFDLVDAALASAGALQHRVRDLPSRVVVYLLIAAAMFPEVGYQRVWAKLTAALRGADGLSAHAHLPNPTPAGMAQARRRVGVAPLAGLLDLLMPATPGPRRGRRGQGVWWWGRRVCAIDGTTMCCPDTPANLTRYTHGGSNHGGTGYPMLRLLALVTCGTRTLEAVTFGPTGRGETRYAADLSAAMGPGMIVLADRNFAATNVVTAITATGADLLIRTKITRRLPCWRRLRDGSYISRIGAVEVRVIRAGITVNTAAGTRRETYQLITTVTDRTDPDITAADLVKLYHQRWEIESAYLELKSTLGTGRVLRARVPQGVDQEVYALLIAYQGLRTAIADATSTEVDLDPDRASFTIALATARDQLVLAAGIIDQAAHASEVDLLGAIGAAVLSAPLPDRRCRITPRVVKRAISNYAPSTRKGRLRGPTYKATISIDVLAGPDP